MKRVHAELIKKWVDDKESIVYTRPNIRFEYEKCSPPMWYEEFHYKLILSNGEVWISDDNGCYQLKCDDCKNEHICGGFGEKEGCDNTYSKWEKKEEKSCDTCQYKNICTMMGRRQICHHFSKWQKKEDKLKYTHEDIINGWLLCNDYKNPNWIKCIGYCSIKKKYWFSTDFKRTLSELQSMDIRKVPSQ